MSKSGDIKGLDKLLKDLIKLGDEGANIVKEVTEEVAEDIEFDAKLRAPINKQKQGGSLRQSIRALKVSELTWKVYANVDGKAPYAAYVEFGTGVSENLVIPEEMADMAWAFKGSKSIVGQQAQPYLYPAFVKGRAKYYDTLKKELKALTKKV